MIRTLRSAGVWLLAATLATPAVAADPVEVVLRELNQTRSVVGSQDIKSYPVLFDAYLAMSPPPMPVGPGFNQGTIHPKMRGWDRVSGWAESNPGMADALLEAERKILFGLPYGTTDVASAYREAALVAEIGAGGSLRDIRFPYFSAIDTIAAFATAESYRLFEAGEIDRAMDVAMANLFMLRQCCDREFNSEVRHAIELLTDSLANLRDQCYLYQDKVSADQFGEVAIQRLPFLRPDRGRLLIPEGDRVVAAALIKELFTEDGQADRDKFASTFAAIQARDAPLTRFGAARRWRIVAEIHDSKEVSLERLQLVYDDWWRRWRVEEYDTILDIPTQFERTNPVRYAAVIYSIEDVAGLFAARNELVAAVHGTSVSVGLCGYKRHFGNYPASSDMMYAQFLRKRADRDPFDRQFAPFKYRVLDARFPVDTPEGRIFIGAGEAILYSKGLNHEDDRGGEHTPDGIEGDIVFWPAIRAIQRKEGLLP